MILAAILLLGSAPAPLNIEVFFDEEAAGQALDVQLGCLGGGAFERRLDTRDSKLVAADVVRSCANNEEILRQRLVDVFSRKPHLRPPNTSAERAAELYVREMNSVVEQVVIAGRERR